MEKVQLLMIHGGTTFKSREDYLNYLRNKDVKLEERNRWQNEYLNNSLGEGFQIIKPKMPLEDNANYEDWKIVFENYLRVLGERVILIGNSLGGIFLAKYLSENKVDKKILSVYLVAPPFDDTVEGEDLVGGFELGKDLSLMEDNCDKVTLMFSKDDPCVPISHAEKYRLKLQNSEVIIYESKNGHFRLEEFPEIVERIKNDVREIVL